MVFKKLEEIPKEFRLENRIKIDEVIIDGEVTKWNGDFYEVLSPIRLKNDDGSYEKVIVGEFPLMSSDEALKEIELAYDTFNCGRGTWTEMCIPQRLSYFEKFLVEMKKYREECINVLMWEIAKNKNAATGEFDRTLEYIEESIEALKDMHKNECGFTKVSGLLAKIRRSSLGVTFVMGPYNYPFNETFATLIPALLMGNTVVVKPPKRGSLIYKYVIKAIAKSFPKGVFNVIFGRGRDIVEPIMQSGKVSVFGFIGSYTTANKIAKMHPKPNRLKLVFGLDAKNLGIVLKDCDVENAVNECIAGTTSYNGQRCTALKLLYVHSGIYDEFVKKYVEKLDSLCMGIPQDNCPITPIIDERVDYFKELTQDALEKGAKIINNPQEDVESFVAPKVFEGVTKDMRLFKEEQFGPLVPIVKFDDLEEPIETVLNSNFGQQCSIFGNDEEEMGELIDFLVNQVSRVNVNAQSQRGPDILPFTGRKDSAVGTLSVRDALKTFSIRTLVTAKNNSENRELYEKMISKNKSTFLTDEVLF